MMSGTYGRTGNTLLSVQSLHMSLSLGSKLRQKTGGLGSILYSTIWKGWVTPAGRWIPALRASAHRSSDKDSIGWPRPTVRDWKDTGDLDGSMQRQDGKWRLDTVPRLAHMTGWARPVAQPANGTPEQFIQRKIDSMARGSQSMGLSLGDIQMQAVTAGWPRPTVGNATGGQSPPEGTTAEGLTPDGRKVTVALPHVVKMTGWPRPCAQDGPKGGPSQGTDRLPAAAAVTGWPRPMARDHFPAHSADYIAEKMAQGHGMANLNDRASLTGWPRPQASDHNQSRTNDPLEYSKRWSARPASGSNLAIVSQAWSIHETANGIVEYRFIPSIIGEMPNGSCAVIQTDRVSGPLNPRHSLWLMLGPWAEPWLRAAERVKRTSRSRKKIPT